MINKNTMCVLSEKIESLPNMFMLDDKPIRFDIDYDLLSSIDVKEGLTQEQANELLKWTSNNTRDNINIINKDWISHVDHISDESMTMIV